MIASAANAGGTKIIETSAPVLITACYAHEAAVASIDYAFDVLGWDNVIHTIDPANTASVAL
eukprot:gene15714-20812_t